MTNQTLKEIVHRAVSDGSFRAQLQTDPAKALAGFDLTAEERTAITTGDPTRLTALGVDKRMSKAFAAGVIGDASKVVVVDDGAAGSVFVDEGAGSGIGAAGVDTAVPTQQSAMWRIEQDLDAGASLEAPADASTHSPMWRVEQDLDASSASSGFLTEDEELAASRPEPAATEHSPMWRVEQDLDAGSSLEAPESAPSTSHLQRVEQDLDAGSSLESPPSDDIQITGDETPTEY